MEPPKVFISHSWEDKEISEKLVDYLKRDGADVWVDYTRISGGDSLPVVIGEGIEWCNTMILLWSQSAIKSYYVTLEWTTALSEQKRIIPCVIDMTPLPTLLKGFLRLDFKNFEIGYQSLALSLKLIPSKENKPALGEETQKEPERPVYEETSHQQSEQTLPKVRLRSEPIENLSVDEVKKILKERNFFSASNIGNLYGLFGGFFGIENKQGKGINHQYEVIEKEGEKLVIDHTTGLTWQQSGSSNSMRYADALKWIEELNKKGFAGFHDWRLPTLEEAMSLMEPKKFGDLYLSDKFDHSQTRIWTSDKESGSVVWVAYFPSGHCSNSHVGNLNYFVRAVR